MNTPITTRDLWIDAKKKPVPLGKRVVLRFEGGGTIFYSMQLFEHAIPRYKNLTHWFEIIEPEDKNG